MLLTIIKSLRDPELGRTMTLEEPVKGALLPPVLELVRLVSQGLLNGLVATQHHDASGPQLERVDRPVLFAQLPEEPGKRRGENWPVELNWSSRASSPAGQM